MSGGKIIFSLSFCDLNETLTFLSKFSMEAYPLMKYELVVQRKEAHILSYHVPKSPKKMQENLLLVFKSSSFKTDSNRNLNVGLFKNRQVCGSLNHKKKLKVSCTDFES